MGGWRAKPWVGGIVLTGAGYLQSSATSSRTPCAWLPTGREGEQAAWSSSHRTTERSPATSFPGVPAKSACRLMIVLLSEVAAGCSTTQSSALSACRLESVT